MKESESVSYTPEEFRAKLEEGAKIIYDAEKNSVIPQQYLLEENLIVAAYCGFGYLFRVDKDSGLLCCYGHEVINLRTGEPFTKKDWERIKRKANKLDEKLMKSSKSKDEDKNNK